MAKLDIPIILIDESVVDYGFRVLMNGYQPEPFASNPILLLQHGRLGEGVAGVNSLQLMPLGKWNNITTQGSKLVGYPEFDDDDADALKVEKKVVKGYYNAASIWIMPIECSDDETLKLPGQYGPTITKWSIREASIVDIPNCPNAVAIRNAAGNKILLDSNTADTKEINDYLKTLSSKIKIEGMDTKLMAAKLGLPEDASDKAINDKLAGILANANEHPQLTTEVTKLKAKVIELTSAAEEKKLTDLVDGAVTATKLMAGDREKWLKLAKADYDTAKELIDAMKPYESIESKLAGSNTLTDETKAELADLLKLSGEDLYMKDKLGRLKELSMPHFKLKYKEFYDKEFVDPAAK